MGALKKGPVEQTADDVASESDNSGDSDLEGMEIDMDSDDEPMSEEDDSDMEAGHYETIRADSESDEDEESRIVDSDEEQDYEQAPRKAEGWSEKGSTRLPIKLADGRIKEVEDNRVRPSEVRDGEESEEEVADSDFAEEDEEEGEQEIEEEAEEKPAKKLPKKVVLAQKKEEMATLAQTIIADPEANVCHLNCSVFFFCPHCFCDFLSQEERERGVRPSMA